MKAFAAKHGFTFRDVIDERQDVARAYGAQCTPDFFGFNAQDELQYRGRLDASRMTPVANARRELFEAMYEAGGRDRPRPGRAKSFDGVFDKVEGMSDSCPRSANVGRIDPQPSNAFVARKNLY